MIVFDNYERSFDEVLKENNWTTFRPEVEIYFHDDRSRFYYERSKFSRWQVEVFHMNGRNF